MKNILLLGDSVRMQYQPAVKELMKDEARVYGPEENCRWSGYLLNSLRFWLPAMPAPDIVQFNCGLWDMGDDYHEGRHFYPPELYEETLHRIFRALRLTTGRDDLKIMVATTTPTMYEDHRDVEIYNGILTRAALQVGAAVNDLYAVIAPEKENLLREDKMHLNEEGVRRAAEATARALRGMM